MLSQLPPSAHDELFCSYAERAEFIDLYAQYASAYSSPLLKWRIVPLIPEKKRCVRGSMRKIPPEPAAAAHAALVCAWGILHSEKAMWGTGKKGMCGMGVLLTGGLCVMDVDPWHSGHLTLQELLEKHGPLPETAVARTPSGSWHYYFQVENPPWSGILGPIHSGQQTSGIRWLTTNSRPVPGAAYHAPVAPTPVPPTRLEDGAYVWETPPWVQDASGVVRSRVAAIPAWIRAEMRNQSGKLRYKCSGRKSA